MTKSELVQALSLKHTQLMHHDVATSVDIIIEALTKALARNERVEIRGFGCFTVNRRPARIGRNPKTGESVSIPEIRIPHFRTGKELRLRVQVSSERG
jgi:integration host factor subunit beta